MKSRQFCSLGHQHAGVVTGKGGDALGYVCDFIAFNSLKPFFYSLTTTELLTVITLICLGTKYLTTGTKAPSQPQWFHFLLVADTGAIRFKTPVGSGGQSGAPAPPTRCSLSSSRHLPTWHLDSGPSAPRPFVTRLASPRSLHGPRARLLPPEPPSVIAAHCLALGRGAAVAIVSTGHGSSGGAGKARVGGLEGGECCPPITMWHPLSLHRMEDYLEENHGLVFGSVCVCVYPPKASVALGHGHLEG